MLLLIKNETFILLEKNEVFGYQKSDSCATIENSGTLDLSDIPFIEPDLNTNMNYQTKENMTDNSSEERNALANIQIININHEEDFNWINYKVFWNKVPFDMLKTYEEGIRDKSVIIEICII